MTIKENGFEVAFCDSKKQIETIAICVNGASVKLFSAQKKDDACDYSIDEIKTDSARKTIILNNKRDNYDVESVISFTKDGLSRCRRYTVKKEFTGCFDSGFMLEDKDILYSYPMRVYEQPLDALENIRSDFLWALPLPAHILHGKYFVVAYFIDHNGGVGTCDFSRENKNVFIGFHYPDCTVQDEVILPFSQTKKPENRLFIKGESFFIKEYIVFSALKDGENAILKAEKMITPVLLKDTTVPNYENVADGIAHYYRDNELWNPNAFGKGLGWYRNMWKRTMGANPVKDFYYDLGWGEGYGSITVSALVRYQLRTKTHFFDDKIKQITFNTDLFLRDKNVRGAYYDRYINSGDLTLLLKKWEGGCCDFLGIKRIWSHSLGMVGYQFAKLYEEAKEYDAVLAEKWLQIAKDVASFIISKQQANGDIQDGFDENDGEANKKKHRIPARAINCGLLCILYRITGERDYLIRAEKLAKAVSPEILKYEFYNQMLDGHVDVVNGEVVDSGIDENNEIYDSENASYALCGLAELYGETGDKFILDITEKCVAYLVSWMYFYDVPTGANGFSRGATTCRMPDFPLCYIGAGNFAVSPLKKLAKLTDEKFYGTVANEMLVVAAKYQWNDPKVKWDGAVVHAVYQVNGKHWGPDIEGQMDTGMTSGSTLVNIENYLKK